MSSHLPVRNRTSLFLAALFLAALGTPQAAHAKGGSGGGGKFFSYGVTFGVQGGSVYRLPEDALDTGATGNIGISLGAQIGGVVTLGPLEARALYDLKRVVADNPDNTDLIGASYTDHHLTVPVMWLKKVKSVSAGGGLFYSQPLDGVSKDDIGVVFTSKFSAEKVPFDADFTCYAGAIRQPSEGNNIRCMAGIGFRLR